MNSSLQKALVASLVAIGMAGSAVGQVVTPPPGGFDYDPHCIDPNNTAPYSNDFVALHIQTPLFEAGIGVSGTVAYKFCVEANGASVAVRGRIGFSNGPQGSIQDDIRMAQGKFDVGSDDYTRVNYGMNSGEDPIFFGVTGGVQDPGAASGSGWSYARIRQQPLGGATTDWLFGGDGFYEYFIGQSNRYMYVDTVHSNVDARCVIDVLADTARVTWTLTNKTTNALNLGLWFGQWVILAGGRFAQPSAFGSLGPGDNYSNILGYFSDSNTFQPYVNIPGHKPLIVDQRFNAQTNPTTFPAFCDFTGNPIDGFLTVPGIFTFPYSGPEISPQLGSGFQVVNASYSNVEDENHQSDQTPVDEFVVGSFLNLLSGSNFGNVATPTFRDLILPDASFGTTCSYLQKWEPATVAVGEARNIVTYYRSVWGDSNYSNGYSAVVDTPKVISANKANPAVFDPNPFTIGVDVDNTGGFGQVYREVTMSNVKVTLQLPQGMHDVNNPTKNTLVKFINSIPFKSMATTSFNVAVDPTVFGLLPYTVTIEPNPGGKKVINGFINVAATPHLLVRGGANLVTSPWIYSNASWEQVLNLQLDQDFQSFTWDPLLQGYVNQSGPQRGIGTWILSHADHGILTLKGNPSQPTDQFPPAQGAPNITLQPGWNLVANPYNYSFQLGQLVGVPKGTTSALSYDEMVQQGIFDGSFAYYQQDLQTYNFLQSDTDFLLPNFGYWVFLNQPITLSFPPVYDLFVRSPQVTKPFDQHYNHWKLQLSAQMSKVSDQFDYVGVTTNAKVAAGMRVRKAPISPASNAMRAFITSVGTPVTASQGGGNRATASMHFAQVMHNTSGKQSYGYNVFTKAGGAVTIKWPNLADIPTNLQVLVTDPIANKTINARSAAGYTYTSGANSLRSFTVTITPQGTIRQSIGQVTETVKNTGSTKQMTINFNLSTRGEADLYVFKGSKKIGTIVVDRDVVKGTNTVVWPMTLSSGQVIQPGTYTLEIIATGEGGDTATKLVTLSL